mmetsp:Transcript_39362/g.111542  ORF Transcript_39362/g.111542 Transcript_39362/m.111542 type:complete len:213 (+) Transcript_39362:440-1078(+)
MGWCGLGAQALLWYVPPPCCKAELHVSRGLDGLALSRVRHAEQPHSAWASVPRCPFHQPSLQPLWAGGVPDVACPPCVEDLVNKEEPEAVAWGGSHEERLRVASDPCCAPWRQPLEERRRRPEALAVHIQVHPAKGVHPQVPDSVHLSDDGLHAVPLREQVGVLRPDKLLHLLVSPKLVDPPVCLIHAVALVVEVSLGWRHGFEGRAGLVQD